MKVKDYINKLNELDPDTDIWVLTDGIAFISPIPSSSLDKDWACRVGSIGLKATLP